MGSSLGKIFIFLLILGGIFTYLLTGAALFGKVQSSVVQIEMKSIDRALRGEYFQKNRYPRQRHFLKFLASNLSKEAGKVGHDPWGVLYHYEVDKRIKGYILVSAGMNKTFGDEDDVTLTRSDRSVEVTVGPSKVRQDTRAQQVATQAVKQEKVDQETLDAQLEELLDMEQLLIFHLEVQIDEEIANFITSLAKEEKVE